MSYEKTPDYRIKRRGKTYWAHFSKKGIQVDESLHTRNYDLARRLVDQIESKILLGEDWREGVELVEDLWPQFISDMRRGVKVRGRKPRRESTIYHYEDHYRRFFGPFFGSMSITRAAKEETWTAYVESVQKTKPDIRFFNHAKYFGSFLSWAVRQRKIRQAPELFNPDKARINQAPNEDESEEDGVGKVFTKDELFQLLTKAPWPLQLALYMARYMGMRRSEITQLPRSQIKIDGNNASIRLYARQVKTGQGRIIPIPAVVIPLLERRLKETEGCKYLFPNNRQAKRQTEPMDRGGFKKPWTKLRAELGIEGRFHDFRHTYLTEAFSVPGIPALLICEAAGLSMTSAQQVYLHFTEKDLQAVADLFQKSLSGAKSPD